MGTIAENLEQVEQKILDACKKSGRNRDEVTLIAVSKTKPIELIYEALHYGHNIFGENKVQELREKAHAMAEEDIHWHMIGHLQQNKVKYLPHLVDMIHSVESEKLALEIERQAAKSNLIIDILCEVNVAGEKSKYGLNVSEVPDFIRSLLALPHLRVRGLMTVAPYTHDPETNRPYFKELKKLLEYLNNQDITALRMDTLSMGMTADYEVAIEEGATMVRVGTGIFGERDYSV